MKDVADLVGRFSEEEFRETLLQTDETLIRRILSKTNLSLTDFYHLLSPAALRLLPEIALKAQAATIRRFGKIVSFYAPIYLSNECDNHCVYCGFNHTVKTPRVTLTKSEIEKELLYLKKTGFDNVLLLTGESAKKAGVDYIADAVALAKQYFTFVGLEIYALSEIDYAKLVRAGADGLTIYQETYHRETYARMHPKGKKSGYLFRLEAPERALAAGFRKIGIGALLGLYRWEYEAAMLAHHLKYLRKKFWKADTDISFPRIQPFAGNLPANRFAIPFPVSDRDLILIICALRLIFPDTGFVLSTRESPVMRDRLVGLCITRISAGSKTNPGGYSQNGSLEQFSVSDSRELKEMMARVSAMGYDPVIKDWDPEFRGDYANGKGRLI